jgi:lipid II:glycine glycyltransferase (peptidoglycan interpeptide bridge formation enzyme)
MFVLHRLDLRPTLDEIFENFHKDCVQRKIRRAARERLTYEEGTSESLVSKFYQLLLMTRRRHGLPAQPTDWFRNIVGCVGDRARIRVASKDGRPIAGILTLRYKHVLVYKYGCSDNRFSNLGGTQLLLWAAITEAKRNQLSEFDMGRSDCDNPGLIEFKDRWGAARATLIYYRYPSRYVYSLSEATQASLGKYVWSHMPPNVLAAAGKMLYKYVG